MGSSIMGHLGQVVFIQRCFTVVELTRNSSIMDHLGQVVFVWRQSL